MPSSDRPDADILRIDLHEHHRMVLDSGRGEAGLERLHPSAVVDTTAA